MRPDAAPSTPVADEVPLEPFLRWAGTNVLRLTIYLAAASVGTAAVLTSDVLPYTWEEVVATAGYKFLVGGLLGIPGTILLLLLMSQLPPEWSARDRRVVAALASPLIQIVLLGLFLYSRPSLSRSSSDCSSPQAPRSSCGSANGGRPRPGLREDV